jgi:hypothetical protein
MIHIITLWLKCILEKKEQPDKKSYICKVVILSPNSRAVSRNKQRPAWSHDSSDSTCATVPITSPAHHIHIHLRSPPQSLARGPGECRAQARRNPKVWRPVRVPIDLLRHCVPAPVARACSHFCGVKHVPDLRFVGTREESGNTRTVISGLT